MQVIALEVLSSDTHLSTLVPVHAGASPPLTASVNVVFSTITRTLPRSSSANTVKLTCGTDSSASESASSKAVTFAVNFFTFVIVLPSFILFCRKA